MERARIVAELADAGSIDALLDRHSSLSREQVVSTLHDAAQLIDEQDRPLPPVSPLYRAYNGFMLGLFTAAAFVFDAHGEAERHHAALRRVSEFLLEFTNEFGKEVDLEGEVNLEDAIDSLVRALDPGIADYYQLGLATFRVVVIPDREDAPADAAAAERLLASLGHAPALFATMLDDSARAPDAGDRTWQDLMTLCLGLLRNLVASLEEEIDTCFVALPFKPPYEERYLNFYCGVARRLGLRSVRAWGGLGNEEHQELLLALIARSATLLADVTEPNANVALEVGFALGHQRSVFLLGEQDAWKNTANIQLDWVFPYRVQNADVPPGEVEKAGLYFTALKALRRPGPVPGWAGKPIVVLQAMNEIFAARGEP